MAQKRPRTSESNTNNSNQMSSSRWSYETVEGCHEFKIEGYSLAKGLGVGSYIPSGVFTVGGHDWFILFYPDGNTEACQDWTGVYLNLVSPGYVKAAYEFKLLDQTGMGKHGNVFKHPDSSPSLFEPGISSWGFTHFMMRSELENSTNYLKDDCLSILCTITVVQARVETLQTRVEQETHCVIPVPPSDMSQNFKGLLESGIGSDITIQVGNESFKAHKSILAARSPVFREIFFGLVDKPYMETVAFEEFDPLALKVMLVFLYSDELPEERELFDSDSDWSLPPFMQLQHLLAVADHFGLSRLKHMCEAKLSEKLTTNNVANTLILAEDHQFLQLKTTCLNFAAKPENAGEVMKSDGFAHLAESFPKLIIDLFETSAVVDKN